jgi:hypothetical protein
MSLATRYTQILLDGQDENGGKMEKQPDGDGRSSPPANDDCPFFSILRSSPVQNAKNKDPQLKLIKIQLRLRTYYLKGFTIVKVSLMI